VVGMSAAAAGVAAVGGAAVTVVATGGATADASARTAAAVVVGGAGIVVVTGDVGAVLVDAIDLAVAVVVRAVAADLGADVDGDRAELLHAAGVGDAEGDGVLADIGRLGCPREG